MVFVQACAVQLSDWRLPIRLDPRYGSVAEVLQTRTEIHCERRRF